MIYIILGVLLVSIFIIVFVKQKASQEPYSYELIEQEKILDSKEQEELLKKAITLYKEKRGSLDA